ncbi:MAG: hypothetical protein H0U61_00435 [Nocardioidaceae bacterium]|nr:hypothetical protein [Nocardioidaceae bacterium]
MRATTTRLSVAELHRLRDSIDNLDAALMRVLAERFRCTRALPARYVSSCLRAQVVQAADLRVGDLIVADMWNVVRLCELETLDTGNVIIRYTNHHLNDDRAWNIDGAPGETGYAPDKRFVVLARDIPADAVRSPRRSTEANPVVLCVVRAGCLAPSPTDGARDRPSTPRVSRGSRREAGAAHEGHSHQALERMRQFVRLLKAELSVLDVDGQGVFVQFDAVLIRCGAHPHQDAADLPLW